MKTKRIAALAMGILMLLCSLGASAVTAEHKSTVAGNYVTKGLSEDNSECGAIVTFVREDGRVFKASTDEKSGIGSFSAEVPAGLYDIVITKPGYLEYKVSGVRVVNRNIQIPELCVLPGDLDGDGVIGTKDLAVFIRGFNTDEEYKDIRSIADFDNDGVLTVTDMSYLKPNYDRTNDNYEWSNIVNLQTDYRDNPLGIDFKEPEFNWAMESTVRGQKQTAYKIGVASTYAKAVSGEFDVWDSGKVMSNNTHAVYGKENGEGAVTAKQLLPETEYYWTVTAFDMDEKEVHASQIATFETALFGDFGENNKWIELGGGADSAPYCELSEGSIELNITCINTAIGVWFWTKEDSTQQHMWYFGSGNDGTSYFLKPHYNNTGSWLIADPISLSNANITHCKPFDVVINIANGVATTTVNGYNAGSYTLKGDNSHIGKISLRLSGDEAGIINYYTIKDKDGNVFYTNKGEDDVEEYMAPTQTSSVYFRKQFTLNKDLSEVEKARLYSTAAGSQVMYLNGKRASDDYMAPGKSQFTSLLYYQTADVTDLILDGDNTVAAEVGHGWYNAGAVSAVYGTKVGLRAKLVITYKDGTSQVVDTDSTWQSTNNGPTYINGYYSGHKVDARKKIDRWNENDCEYDNWMDVKAGDSFTSDSGYKMSDNLVAENMEPVRNIAVLHPTSVTQLEDGSFLYRFDRNFVGTSRITAKASRGTKITLYYAEALKNGNCVERNETTYRNHNGVDEYIFRGDDAGETVEFDFGYHGYQYIQIFGLTESLPFENIEGLVLASDMQKTGSFVSSNETINKYMEAIENSIEGNFVSTLTDCPTREKNTWTGDAQLFAPTAGYFSNIFNHYRNFETMVSSSQTGDGAIPEIVPSMRKPAETSSGANGKTPSGWSDCVIFIPWEIYNQYGDVQIIKDNYNNMKKWIDFLLKEKIYFAGDTTKTLPYYINEETADFIRIDGNYGDHVAYYAGRSDVGYRLNEFKTTSYGWYETSFAEIGTAVTAYSCKILGKMALEIGETEDAEYYLELSDKFANAWRKNFVAEDGYTALSAGRTTVTTIGGETVYTYNPNVTRTYISGEEHENLGLQSSYCMGLYFDLYETPELKAKAAENLVKLLEYENYNMTVGYMGINYLFPVLSDAGYFDVALKVFENEEYPSILSMIKAGATTIWETYDGRMSQNHYIYGAPGRWIYTDILGINHGYTDGNAGFEHFELNPSYGKYDGTKLNYAKGSYNSVNGVIESEWHYSKDDGVFTYKCRVPANTSATLSLPVENENARITENGEDISKSRGVEYIKTKNGRKYYEITSGVYEFTIYNK